MTYDYEVALSGVTDTTTINTRTLVGGGPNPAPTANAGPNQTVASAAAGVTLTGLGSTNPKNTALTHLWSQTGGTIAVTLSSTTVAQLTFNAPAVALYAAAQVLTTSLSVSDGVNTSSAVTAQITLQAPIDVTDPTVTLAGMPASVMPGEIVSISVTFSEAVTGTRCQRFHCPERQCNRTDRQR